MGRAEHWRVASGHIFLTEIVATAQRGRLVAGLDSHFLTLAGFQLVDVIDGGADAGKHRGHGLTDFELGGKHRVIARDRDFAGSGHALATGGHDFFECGCHFWFLLLCEI